MTDCGILIAAIACLALPCLAALVKAVGDEASVEARSAAPSAADSLQGGNIDSSDVMKTVRQLPCLCLSPSWLRAVLTHQGRTPQVLSHTAEIAHLKVRAFTLMKCCLV